jgi:hypothetical protein
MFHSYLDDRGLTPGGIGIKKIPRARVNRLGPSEIPMATPLGICGDFGVTGVAFVGAWDSNWENYG